MRGFVHRLTTRGVRRALGRVASELALLPRHNGAVRKARALSRGGDLRLQLGCGDQPKTGWINVDLFNPSADLALDLREPLPFDDNTVEFVYTEHVFEHLDYPVDARHVLREVQRVLKPGGILSIVVPNCGDALQAYAAHDEAFFSVPGPRSYLLGEHPTLMHHVNFWFRQDGEHLYAYDAETLGQVLRDAGFVAVRERDFDPALDSEKRRRVHSLYMEGTKGPLEQSRITR